MTLESPWTLHAYKATPLPNSRTQRLDIEVSFPEESGAPGGLLAIAFDDPALPAIRVPISVIGYHDAPPQP